MLIIPSKSINDIIKYLSNNIKYNKLTVSECNEYFAFISSINNNYKINVSNSQALSIRDTFIYLLSKTKGTKAHRLGDSIMIDYKNKINIIDISKKYDLPPMSIVRQILIENKYESHKIDKIIKKQSFSKDIESQMPIIIKNDPNSWFSLKFPNIHKKINNLNCKYQLKYDLQKNGKHPDILFDKICVYKNDQFNWIVFKPYVLFNSKLHIHDIQKTVNNFQRFGKGLILYNDIICSKSFIKKINVSVNTYDLLD